MGFFQNRKRKPDAPVVPIPQTQLQDLPYALDFELPREEPKLRAVFEHEKAGGDFDIRKVLGKKGTRAKIVMTVGNFPDYDDLLDIVKEEFGGGSYTIHPAGSPKVFKRYELDGRSKFLVGGPKPKSPNQKMKEEFEARALTRVMKEMKTDAEFREQVAWAFAEKEFGIEIARPTLDEKHLQEALDEDPEFRQLYRQQLLEKPGGETTSEPNELDRMLAQAGKFQEIRELLGGRSGGWQEFVKEAGPAIVELLQVVTKARSGGAPGPSVTPDPQPVQEAQLPEPTASAGEKVPDTGRFSLVTPEDQWNLAASESSISSDAIADLLEVWKVSIRMGRRFTIRQAKWAALLRSTLKGPTDMRISPEDLHFWSLLYSGREIEGNQQDLNLNTGDLDAELAFRYWESGVKEWEYDQTVATGKVPSSGKSLVLRYGVVGQYVETFHMRRGRYFLEEEDGENLEQRPWRQSAMLVTAFWLQKLSEDSEQWNNLPLSDLDYDPSWLEMATELARAVIVEANRLDSGKPYKLWRPDGVIEMAEAISQQRAEQG